MLVCCQLLVAAALLLGSGVVGQCVDCNRFFNAHCRVNKTGYFCEPGAVIVKGRDPRPNELRLPSYECTPPLYEADYINTFCCFFSPELGCHLAINPSMMIYENRPISRCMECSAHCDCVSDCGSTPFQSGTMFWILGSLALSLISGPLWVCFFLRCGTYSICGRPF